MIKVCHIADEMRIGGLEHNIKEIALNLKGYEQHVWCLKALGVLAQDLENKGICVRTLNFPGRLNPSSILKLGRELKHEKFDIVHTHGVFPGIWGTLGGIAGRVPHILFHSQNIYYDAGLQLKIKLFFLKGYVERYIAASEAVKKSLVQCVRVDPKKITVIYNSAAPRPHSTAELKTAQRRALGLHPDDFVIGTISRLETHKGHRYLLEAIETLLPAIPRLKCLIIGEGGALGDLKTAIRSKNIERAVDFTGWQKDIDKYLNVMDVFVQPSTLREGLPLALAEAASAGVPLIATDIGGNAEIVKEDCSGFIIPPKNTKELAEKIKYLFEYPKTRHRFGENAKKIWEESFTLEAMLHKIDALYSRVCFPAGQ